jgi:hypothetical protein
VHFGNHRQDNSEQHFESAYSFYGEKLFFKFILTGAGRIVAEAKTDELSEYEQLRQPRKEQQQQQATTVTLETRPFVISRTQVSACISSEQ